MAKKKVVRKSAAKRGAAKSAAKKSAKKVAKKPAKRSASRKAAPKAAVPSNIVTREHGPYAIHLGFDQYKEFAQAMTAGPSKRYHHSDKHVIERFIEDELQQLQANVLTGCDPNDTRRFGPNDRIKVEIDHRGQKVYRIALPAYICEDASGNVDLEYLRQYVQEIRNTAHSIDDCAYALLGMYFLSRCR